MTTEHDADLKQQSDQLYAQYVKPLERDHRGEFAAVAKDGRILLGDDLLTLTDQAVEALGPGSFTFKIGEKAIGKWR
jgi:hypothetical protein